MDGVVAAAHFDRIAFKARRTFVTLAPDARSANFKFRPEEQELQCLLRPEAFRPVPNASGAQGWTVGVLAELDLRSLQDALRIAYAHGAAPAGRTRRFT